MTESEQTLLTIYGCVIGTLSLVLQLDLGVIATAIIVAFVAGLIARPRLDRRFNRSGD